MIASGKRIERCKLCHLPWNVSLNAVIDPRGYICPWCRWKLHKRRHLAAYVLSIPLTAVLLAFLIAGGLDAEARAEWTEPEPTATPSPVVIAWPEDNPSQTSPDIYYPLSNADRAEIEQTVMAEAGAEPFEGQMAIAQCIMDAAVRDSISPVKALSDYRYTPTRKEPSREARQAVSAVFDRGERVTEEPILYFYAPALCEGKWHETHATYVMTIGGHRFFR